MYFVYANMQEFYFEQGITEHFLHRVKGVAKRVRIETGEFKDMFGKNRYFRHDITLMYDPMGNVNYVRSERDTGRIGDRTTRQGYATEFKYNNNNSKQEQIVRRYEINDRTDFRPGPSNEEIIRFSYDENGNRCKTERGNWRSEFNYDTAGRLIEKVSYSDDVKDGYTEYQYDDRNRVTKMSEYGHYIDESGNYVDENWNLEKKPLIRLKVVRHFEYEELSEGRVRCTQKESSHLGMDTVEVFEFDDQFKLESRRGLNDNGRISGEFLYTYENDDLGNVIQLTITVNSYSNQVKTRTKDWNFKRIIEYA
jgi:hypothetical protein